jgi:hypothetical protein
LPSSIAELKIKKKQDIFTILAKDGIQSNKGEPQVLIPHTDNNTHTPKYPETTHNGKWKEHHISDRLFVKHPIHVSIASFKTPKLTSATYSIYTI